MRKPGAPSAGSGMPGAGAVMARAGGENFPVASRLLLARDRAHLLALYGYARLVDELGDSHAGDRLAALDELEADLERCFAASGSPRHELLAGLAPTVRECGLPIEPFRRLIEANRRDQLVHRYGTFEELRGYCALSADPVGELVLHVFGAATPERLTLSSHICTALQLAEHWQDVAEDYRAGRIYLPAEDLERFGVQEAQLAEPHAPPALRSLLAFEVARARQLLDSGAPLIGTLRGRRRIALAAFVAGGRAALEAIARAHYDVLAGPPRAGRSALLAELARALAGAGGRTR
jgi:squalene synthase HpnC